MQIEIAEILKNGKGWVILQSEIPSKKFVILRDWKSSSIDFTELTIEQGHFNIAYNGIFCNFWANFIYLLKTRHLYTQISLQLQGQMDWFFRIFFQNPKTNATSKEMRGVNVFHSKTKP